MNKKRNLAKENNELKTRLAEAEEMLRQSELEKMLILDHADESIAFHDRDRRIQWANRRYQEYTNTSLKKIKGKKCYEAWGLDRSCRNCPVSRALKSGKPENGELMLENQPHWPVGQGFWMVRATPVKNDAGQMIGVIEAVYEITGRKKAEAELEKHHEHLEGLVKRRTKALRESEAQFRALFENMQDGVAHCRMVFDAGGRPIDFIYCRVNNAFGQLTGLEDVIGRRATEILPGIRGTHTELFETYARVTRTGRPERFEIEFKPLAKWFTVSVYGAQPDHFVAIFNDISDRKRMEEVLKKSEKDYERAQAVGNMGNWRLVENNELTWSNETYRIFGIPEGTPLTYEIFLSTIHPEDRDYVDKKWKAAAAGEDYDLEHRIVVDGKVKWVREKAFLEFDDKGNFISGFGISQDITDRKQVETAAQKDRNLLRTLIANIPDLIYFKDVQHRFVAANQATAQIMRCESAEDLLGKTDFDFYPEDFAKKFHFDEEEIFKTGQPKIEIEEDVLDEKGQIRIFRTTKACLKDDFGNVIGLVGLGRDVTEHKQFQEALKKSEEKYRDLIETSNSIIMKTDKNLTMTYMNEFGLKFFGYTAQELIGQNVMGTIVPEKDDEGRNLIAMAKDLLTKPEKYQTNVRQNKRKNGERVWISWSHKEKFDGKGEIVEILSVGNDIHRLKKAEEAMKESERRLQLALQVSHSFAFEWDPVSDKVARSESCGPILWLWGNEAVTDSGKNYFQRVHPGDCEGLIAVIQALRPDNASYQTEYRVVRGDGAVVTLEEMGQASFDVQGKLVRLVGTATDITTRKEAEKILKRDEETLRRLVKEQAHDLLVAQIELERASRLSDIGVLAATVAHELRNPLAAIGMAAYNIKRKARLEKMTGFDKSLAAIEKKVSDSEQIISNLLFYSRLKRPHYKPCDLLDVLEESIELIEGKREKNVAIIRKIDALKGLSIEVDAVQIKEVFNNLLNNAYDAVVSQKGKIKIVAENKDEFIRVTIEDNGSGIDKSILAKIFDPFFTTKAKGTGLGLSVCRQIMNLHGGEMEVESEPRHGTSFMVRLPKKRRIHD